MTIEFVHFDDFTYVSGEADLPCYGLTLRYDETIMAISYTDRPLLQRAACINHQPKEDARWTLEHVMTPWPGPVRSPLYDAPWPDDDHEWGDE